MEAKANKRPLAIRYFGASVLFLILGVRFFSMGDQIGTTIYGAITAVSLLVAFVHLVNKDLNLKE